jgi:uncharacterized protein YjbI with pentapeptide repeats
MPSKRGSALPLQIVCRYTAMLAAGDGWGMADKPDPNDVEALERALNDSATHVSTLSFSYVIFAVYLFIATGMATPRQLFLDEPLELPVFSVALPPYWFFVLTPLGFVLFHVYLLLQVLLLSRTAAEYNATLDKAVLAPADNARMRQRLANTLFAQIFAGSPRERGGWLGGVLLTAAWFTLAFLPMFIMLFFQFRFLPYHSHFATWFHRVLLLAELLAYLLLWPLVLNARRDFSWKELRRRLQRRFVPVAAAILCVVVSLLFVTFPGEPLINLLRGRPASAVECDGWLTRHDGWFSGYDRLRLPSIDTVDDKKLDEIEKATAAKGKHPWEGERTRIFKDRDLSCGVFESADLRRADFRGANLAGAQFSFAELQGADFEKAQLRGANLAGATLHSANLRDAQLQGADLGDVQAPGANLHGAALQGANLADAQLQGANLTHAGLQGALLESAKLQGANLAFAQLHGANLDRAQLQGVNLDHASLQGAVLVNANLQHALISNASVWNARDANCNDARVLAPRFNRAWPQNDAGSQGAQPATADAIEKFLDGVFDGAASAQKDQVRKRLQERLLDPQKDGTAETWRTCAANALKTDEARYLQLHTDYLRDLVCRGGPTTDQKEAKEIAEGVITAWIFSGDSDFNLSDDSRRTRGLLSLDDASPLARSLMSQDGRVCAIDLRDRKGLRRYAEHRPRLSTLPK